MAMYLREKIELAKFYISEESSLGNAPRNIPDKALLPDVAADKRSRIISESRPITTNDRVELTKSINYIFQKYVKNETIFDPNWFDLSFFEYWKVIDDAFEKKIGISPLKGRARSGHWLFERLTSFTPGEATELSKVTISNISAERMLDFSGVPNLLYENTQRFFQNDVFNINIEVPVDLEKIFLWVYCVRNLHDRHGKHALEIMFNNENYVHGSSAYKARPASAAAIFSANGNPYLINTSLVEGRRFVVLDKVRVQNFSGQYSLIIITRDANLPPSIDPRWSATTRRIEAGEFHVDHALGLVKNLHAETAGTECLCRTVISRFDYLVAERGPQ